MVITSKSNPLVRDIYKLKDKKFRKERGLYIAEGVKLVNESSLAGCAVERLVCTPRFAESYPEATLISEEVYSYLSDEKSPQGVMAVIKIPQNALCAPQGNCLLLDRIRDPGNIGAIIRTANAAGYREIYTIDCADPYSPKAVRSSMSGIFFVKVFDGSENEVLSALSGVPVICADMDGENVFKFDPPPKFCLCIGNEGSGISDKIMERAKFRVKIPMDNSTESLNAAVSAGIAMYALVRRKFM